MCPHPDPGGLVPEAEPYAPTTERLDVDSYLSSASTYLIYLFHVATYEFAADRLPGTGRVLDYGCGTGYGAHLLAESGRTVVGVDVSQSAVRYAASRYMSPLLEFRAVPPVESAPLPFGSGSFDAVVSFQVIEHVPSVDAYLAEVARVLAPGGVFLCATPDRTTRLYRRQRPWNRWHLEEFTPEQLTGSVARHLDVTEVLGMTAPPTVLEIELRRCRMLRRASLPFTFPGAPESWRVLGLEGMRKASDVARSIRGRRMRRSAEGRSAGIDPTYPFGLEDVVIAGGVHPSTNIVLVATKRDEAQPS